MSDLALPPHLRGKKHGDWPWPFKGVSRGWNARGPRESEGSKDYLPWPPKLVKGYGVARWENAGGKSIVMIPDLINKEVTARGVYGFSWRAIEMNPGSSDFLKEKTIELVHENVKVIDEQQPDGTHRQIVIPDLYSPSALQKFSPKGSMILEPYYYSTWKVLKKRELPVWPETGEDTVLFFRTGYRPDHVDTYYNKSIIATIGLHWE